MSDLKQRWWSTDIYRYSVQCRQLAAAREEGKNREFLLKFMFYTEQRYPNQTKIFNQVRKEAGIEEIRQ